MRPLKSKYFGHNTPHSLDIFFYNGVGVVKGYILRQTGPSRYIVTDGTTTLTVRLAQTTARAAIAGGITNGTHVLGEATILYHLGGSTRYVKKLNEKLAHMTDGTVLRWVVSDLKPATTTSSMNFSQTSNSGNLAAIGV